MTKEQAHAVLDAVRAGVPCGWQQINQALLATGDLIPCRLKAQEGTASPREGIQNTLDIEDMPEHVWTPVGAWMIDRPALAATWIGPLHAN